MEGGNNSWIKVRTLQNLSAMASSYDFAPINAITRHGVKSISDKKYSSANSISHRSPTGYPEPSHFS